MNWESVWLGAVAGAYALLVASYIGYKLWRRTR